MGFRVLKFGGSSVASATAMSRVLDIVGPETEKGRVVLVSSAISGCTDALLSCAAGDESGIPALKERHLSIVRRLFTGEERMLAAEEVSQLFADMAAAPDDEKVTFIVNPCGSGGRLQEMGGYEPEIGLAKIKEACNITFQLEDFPIYCIHCPVMQAQEVERFGNFSWVKGYKDGEVNPCCVYHYYKNKADIPEKYYEEIGKEKPQAE